MKERTMRNPHLIAADLLAHREAASTAFVPQNIVQAMDLMLEFAASAGALLAAAGLEHPAPEAPKVEG